MSRNTVLLLDIKKNAYTLKFIFLLMLVMGEFLLASLYFASQQSENERAFVFGFSILRFSTIIFLGSIAVAILTLCVLIFKRNRWGLLFERSIKDPKAKLVVKWIFGLAGVICWIIYFVPPRRFNDFEGYIILMRPLLLLGVLVSCQTIAFIFLTSREEVEIAKEFGRRNKRILLVWAMVSITFILVWAFIAISHIGLSAHNEDYWYEAGVPVLALQVLSGLAIGLAFAGVESAWTKRGVMQPQIDIMIFIVIWIIGGSLWARIPVPNGYLNPGPYPPTYETYPFADAARFDLMSQYALSGQGLNNGNAYSRPAYPVFLVFLHLISGQNYEQNMQVQAAIYGIFPALIYFVAKLLLNRGAGIAVSVMIIMRGINGIAATNMLNLANQKQMLTEFPVAIWLAAILLISILWIRNPGKLFLPLLAGGLFGMSLYLRQTILGVLPVVLFLPTFRRVYDRKMIAAIVSIFLLGTLMVMAPYELKHSKDNPNIQYPSTIRKIISVIADRYPQQQERTSSNGNTDIRQRPLSEDKDSVQIQSDASKDGSPGNGEETDKPTNNPLVFICNHFLHNIVTSVLILPNSFSIENLKGVIGSEDSPWRISWSGRLSFVQSLMLMLNLLVISLGIVVSIRKQPVAGLLPLFLIIGYNLANAFGRTSGGRYIVPSDWVMILYYGIGLFVLFTWVSCQMGIISNQKSVAPVPVSLDIERISVNKVGWIIIVIVLFLLGMLLIMPDIILKNEVEFADQSKILDNLSSYDAGVYRPYIEEILTSPSSIMMIGNVMYPRFYPENGGEDSYYYPYKKLEYPRLAFTLISLLGTQNVILAGDKFDNIGITNTANVIVFGCKEKDDYIDAVLIMTTETPRIIYLRNPLPEPKCPLPDHLCENGICD